MRTLITNGTIVTAEVSGLRTGGILADVAPAALDLLGVDQPDERTGETLIDHPPPI